MDLEKVAGKIVEKLYPGISKSIKATAYSKHPDIVADRIASIRRRMVMIRSIVDILREEVEGSRNHDMQKM